MYGVLAAILILGNVMIEGCGSDDEAKINANDEYLVDACVSSTLLFL